MPRLEGQRSNNGLLIILLVVVLLAIVVGLEFTGVLDVIPNFGA